MKGRSLADLLRKGWTKGQAVRFTSDGTKQYCLTGGLDRLHLDGLRMLRDIISELFPERMEKIGGKFLDPPRCLVVRFNDMRETTKDQVLKVAEEFDRRYADTHDTV